MLLQKAKESYWEVRHECSDLYLRFLMWVPFRMGSKVRSLMLPRLTGGMGKNNAIQDSVHISDPLKLSIGSNCQIARRVTITAGGGIRIGDWVGIGPDAKIWSVNHIFVDPDVPWILQGWEYKQVTIDDDVWIGANAFIMPGVHIGKGAIISAGSVILKSVPPFAVMAGNPGRIMGWRKKPEQPLSKPEQPVSPVSLDEIAHLAHH